MDENICINVITRVLQVYPKEISMDSNLVTDLGADSIDIVQMLRLVETENNVKISDINIENIVTVSDLDKVIDTVLKKEVSTDES